MCCIKLSESPLVDCAATAYSMELTESDIHKSECRVFVAVMCNLLSAVFPRIVGCELEDAGGRFNWF
jgi:hypothetical protein